MDYLHRDAQTFNCKLATTIYLNALHHILIS